MRNRPDLNSHYTDSWPDLVDFEMCDAAKLPERYCDPDGRDYTHIYSYNKVMSPKDIEGIATILNRTNYRILAWYFNPRVTESSGLRDFVTLGHMPMKTTGGENFTVYVYLKIFRYVPGLEAAWKAYDEEEEDGPSEKDVLEEGPLFVRAKSEPAMVMS